MYESQKLCYKENSGISPNIWLSYFFQVWAAIVDYLFNTSVKRRVICMDKILRFPFKWKLLSKRHSAVVLFDFHVLPSDFVLFFI